MKKSNLIIFLVCILLLAGCSSNKNIIYSSSDYNTNSVASESKADTTNTETEKTQTTNAGDSYRIYTESPSTPMEFDKEISDNQIDKDYQNDLNQATTTEEIINVQSKYIDKWKEEMQNALSKLKTILDETDYSNFKIAQDEWEKQMLDNSKIDKNIISNDQYNIMLGSDYGWMYLSNIREQYRERVFHIEYMIYLIQTKGYV